MKTGPLRRIRLIPLLGLVCLTLWNCAGAQGRFRFAGLAYPVSMTAVIPGPQGRLLKKDRELAVVGSVEEKFSRYASCYTLGASDGPNEDPSVALNRLITNAGGVGMVNVTITNESCFWNYFIPFSLLPFWVGCTNMIVRGEIVRFK